MLCWCTVCPSVRLAATTLIVSVCAFCGKHHSSNVNNKTNKKIKTICIIKDHHRRHQSIILHLQMTLLSVRMLPVTSYSAGAAAAAATAQ